MSTNLVEVVEITHVKPHPDADRLDVAIVFGTLAVVVGKGDYVTGDKAVYFPPDMLIPERVAEELGVAKYLKHCVYPGDFSKTKCRIAGCRLRGHVSYGFLVPMAGVFFGGDDPPVGSDCTAMFNAVKYEPPVKPGAADSRNHHPAFHQYTSIEHWYRFPEAIRDGEDVRITEKIHGTNSRVGLVKTVDAAGDATFEFMAGSHKVNRRPHEEGQPISFYWRPLYLDGMMALLTELCDEQHSVIAFGELYGPTVQDMDYGVSADGLGYRVFDISVDGQYLDWDAVAAACQRFGIDTVPLLYLGPFRRELVEEYTHGGTTVGEPTAKFKGREGVVITTTREQYYAPTGGRRIVKSVSADYLDRRDAKDNGDVDCCSFETNDYAEAKCNVLASVYGAIPIRQMTTEPAAPVDTTNWIQVAANPAFAPVFEASHETDVPCGE